MIQTKICKQCYIEKDLVDFHTHPLGKLGRRAICKLCRNATMRNYNRRKGIPERIKRNKNQRDYHYKSRYGLTVDDVDLWKEQVGYKCQVCGNMVDARKLHIDHCHKTGQVRDLLCSNCNKALGNVFDNVEILEKLIIYINKWREEWLS